MFAKRGFTLIELLIVIAIIAILALIAIPNFLEAQVRAKVSRAQADMRSIATAIESYFVDYNTYPYVDSIFSVVPHTLTTPVGYITSVKLVDPFAVGLRQDSSGITKTDIYYSYKGIYTDAERNQLPDPPKSFIADECIDDLFCNKNAKLKYGLWKMFSKGPDRVGYLTTAFPAPLYGSDIMYDPTNGTISFGNIIRTQILSSGVKNLN